MKKNNEEKIYVKKIKKGRKKRGNERWHREESCEKKVEKRQKRDRKRRRERTEEPVGTPPLELQEEGSVDESNPFEKQSNSVCS